MGGASRFHAIVLRDSVWVLPKGSIRRSEIEEATAILSRRVRVADAQRRVLNPEFKPAERPAGPGPAPFRYGRFQFSLRSLLFFVLVASSAMSWYGIHYRRDVAEETKEKAILAQLERFRPGVSHIGDGLWLSFSSSRVKPGDRDLAVVAKFSRLYTLDLSRAPITDAGLVHLERLASLRIVYLWDTQVTDAGVKRLKRALPKADISH